MSAYIHPELQKQIEFISGGYILLEEGRIPLRGKEVLYYLGVAVLDSSCCGRGGCAYIKVPGFVISWKKGVGPGGEAVSEIESVAREEDRQEIRKILAAKFPDFHQIEFL
jgi:hypothetical protein